MPLIATGHGQACAAAGSQGPPPPGTGAGCAAGGGRTWGGKLAALVSNWLTLIWGVNRHRAQVCAALAPLSKAEHNPQQVCMTAVPTDSAFAALWPQVLCAKAAGRRQPERRRAGPAAAAAAADTQNTAQRYAFSPSVSTSTAAGIGGYASAIADRLMLPLPATARQCRTATAHDQITNNIPAIPLLLLCSVPVRAGGL